VIHVPLEVDRMLREGESLEVQTEQLDETQLGEHDEPLELINEVEVVLDSIK